MTAKEDPAAELNCGSPVPLESVLCTEELKRRPARPPDHQAESRALAALIQALSDSPRTILQALADTILEVLQVGSTGISLLTKDEKRFYWPAVAGVWKPHIGGGTPRDFGPCGDVLDHNAPQLFCHPERRYTYIQQVVPAVEECLLVPFYAEGKAVGTIWAIAHDQHRKFDAEDLRQMVSLGRFASAAYQTAASLDALDKQGESLRQSHTELARRLAELQNSNVEARNGRRAALNLMEDAVQARQLVEGLNNQLRGEIAERKRMEEERERLLAAEQEARQEAEAANRAKDEFIAVVSHELRTPLTPILICTRMLNSDSGPAEITRGMEMIERNARLQLRLIEDLLDLNRLAKGKMNIEMGEHDVSGILRSAVESIQPEADHKGIALKIIEADNSLRVRADAGRLQQVFTNILANAVKFTPSGGAIDVSLSDGDHGAVVKVRDTGAGITPEFLPHVFEIFRQQESATQRAHSGLGIGLSVVKRLIDLHGGDIEVKSEGLGLGTDVTVRLPLLEAIGESKANKMPPGKSRVSRALQGFSILLVEDSDDSRIATESLLKKFGAQVISAADGREALKVMAAADPNLILCDLAMPRMDGFEFIEELRRVRGPAHPPVIAVSGLTTQANHQQTRAAGFAGHINKPFDEESLLLAVKHARCAA